MKQKIIGVTVGTPISPDKIEKELKPVKTVNGVGPDNNGNVKINTGGGSGLLIVTLDLITETASHSSTEILAHLSGGGSVIAKIPGNGDFLDEYGHLWSAMDGEVAFYYLWVSSTDTTQYIYTVRADKSIGLMELKMEPDSGDGGGQGVKHYAVTKGGQNITLVLTLDDNSKETHVIALDANGHPTSIAVNGKTVTGEWSGFDV